MYIFRSRTAFIVFVLSWLFIIATICAVRATVVETKCILTGDYSYVTEIIPDMVKLHTGTFESEPITIISLIEDIDRNNEVDFADLNIVRAAYGSFIFDSNWNEKCDLDRNGEIDFVDLEMVRAAYGEILHIESLVTERVYLVEHGE